MQGYRSACVIAKKADSFESCYISEFLKWTGWECFAYSYDGKEENYILECPEKNEFDIFICLNYQGAILHGLKKIEEVFEGSKLIMISTEDYDSEGSMLRDVFVRLAKQAEDFEDVLFQELITIYEKYEMLPMLYAYTLVVIGDRDCPCTNRMYDIYIYIMEEVEALYKKVEGQSWAEYCLYAKLHAKAKVNKLCCITKRLFRYNTEKGIEEADAIYKYDEGFFRAEYIKELFVRADKRYISLAREYIKNVLNGVQ